MRGGYNCVPKHHNHISHESPGSWLLVSGVFNNSSTFACELSQKTRRWLSPHLCDSVEGCISYFGVLDIFEHLNFWCGRVAQTESARLVISGSRVRSSPQAISRFLLLAKEDSRASSQWTQLLHAAVRTPDNGHTSQGVVHTVPCCTGKAQKKILVVKSSLYQKSFATGCC